MKYLIAGFLTLMITGCFGEDDPVAPYIPDGTTITQVSLGSTYEDQVYFSLFTDSVVRVLGSDAYDFAFSCYPGDYSIRTNPIGLYSGANLGDVPIDYRIDTGHDKPMYMNGDSLPYRFERYTGNIEDLIIGQWYDIGSRGQRSLNNLYVVGLGVNRRGKFEGFARLKIDSANTTAYYCRFSNLEGDSVWSAEIKRKPFVNNVFYKVGEGAKDLEPRTEDWDLLFTRYNEKVPDDTGELFDYSVVGVLINPLRIQAKAIKGSFEDFTFVEAQSVEYTDSTNAIGYNWKNFDIDADTYFYEPDLFYAIKSEEGIYYKLRFVSFIDDQGSRGAPKFEYIKL